MKQEKLIKLTAAEIQKLENELSGHVAQYIKIEFEKRTADADYNERMTKLWNEIIAIQTRINEG